MYESSMEASKNYDSSMNELVKNFDVVEINPRKKNTRDKSFKDLWFQALTIWKDVVNAHFAVRNSLLQLEIGMRNEFPQEMGDILDATNISPKFSNMKNQHKELSAKLPIIHNLKEDLIVYMTEVKSKVAESNRADMQIGPFVNLKTNFTSLEKCQQDFGVLKIKAVILNKHRLWEIRRRQSRLYRALRKTIMNNNNKFKSKQNVHSDSKLKTDAHENLPK